MPKQPPSTLTEGWLKEVFSFQPWDIGNEWLYKLCEEYPGHTKVEEVVAKIWLIGRAYAVAAERGISGKGESETYIVRLAQRFVDGNADNYLADLPMRPEKFGDHLNRVVKAHHRFESIFSNKEDDELGRVSLTSKYLHFHRPDLFPIYDSRAATAIVQVTPDSRFVPYSVADEYASSLYGKFCVRCAWLLDEIRIRSGKPPSLRQLDTMLLKIFRDNSIKRKKQKH